MYLFWLTLQCKLWCFCGWKQWQTWHLSCFDACAFDHTKNEIWGHTCTAYKSCFESNAPRRSHHRIGAHYQKWLTSQPSVLASSSFPQFGSTSTLPATLVYSALHYSAGHWFVSHCTALRALYYNAFVYPDISLCIIYLSNHLKIHLSIHLPTIQLSTNPAIYLPSYVFIQLPRYLGYYIFQALWAW